MIPARKRSPLLLPLLAGMAIAAVVATTLLLHTATQAAPAPKPPKTQQASHATVAIVDPAHTTTASFSSATKNLTHNAAGKASLHFVNKTTTLQTISQVGGKTYKLNPKASTVVSLAAGTTATFKLQSNSTAKLTVTVK